jgi:hypothetical protein
MDEDLMFRLDEGMAVVPVNDPRGGLPVCRVRIGDMALQHLAPRPPRRFVLRDQVP